MHLDSRSHVVNPYVLLALRVIDEHYGKADLSTSAVAARLGITAEHLCRLMKSHTGLTFGSHLRRARIVEAQRLIETTTLSMKEIAARTGFRDGSHLDHAFRGAFGTSPRALRAEVLATWCRPTSVTNKKYQ